MVEVARKGREQRRAPERQAEEQAGSRDELDVPRFAAEPLVGGTQLYGAPAQPRALHVCAATLGHIGPQLPARVGQDAWRTGPQVLRAPALDDVQHRMAPSPAGLRRCIHGLPVSIEQRGSGAPIRRIERLEGIDELRELRTIIGGTRDRHVGLELLNRRV